MNCKLLPLPGNGEIFYLAAKITYRFVAAVEQEPAADRMRFLGPGIKFQTHGLGRLRNHSVIREIMAGIRLNIADFQAERTSSGLLLNIFQLLFCRCRFLLSPEIPIFIDLFKIRIFQKIGGCGIQEQNDSCRQQKKHFFHNSLPYYSSACC